MTYQEREITADPNPARRDQVTLILDILDSVPIDAMGNVDTISKAAGARWDTTRRYLELIIMIQNSPKVRLYDVEGSTRVMYRREPGKIIREVK